MKYRNELTGAIIDVESEMGGVWKPVAAPGTDKSAKKAPKKEKKAEK